MPDQAGLGRREAAIAELLRRPRTPHPRGFAAARRARGFLRQPLRSLGRERLAQARLHVARRVADIEATYVGDKAIYFLGVLNNVHHEYLKRPVILQPAQVIADDTDKKEQTYVCLERCLEKLNSNSRTLIESYYSAKKQARIDLRKRLAQQFGISISVLRLRTLRIRQKLQTCIEQCLKT